MIREDRERCVLRTRPMHSCWMRALPQNGSCRAKLSH
jgi:hypothetical protein